MTVADKRVVAQKKKRTSDRFLSRTNLEEIVKLPLERHPTKLKRRQAQNNAIEEF
jgi:hypothetical protein